MNLMCKISVFKKAPHREGGDSKQRRLYETDEKIHMLTAWIQGLLGGPVPPLLGIPC